MTPAQAIAMLDRQLASHGQDVTLQLVNDGAVSSSETQRGFVRGFRPDELVGGITQNDSKIVLSPTGLGSVPKKNSRVVVSGGTPRNVQAVHEIRVADTLVRIELQVRG